MAYSCDHCGASVTPDFWRVFEVNGRLNSCIYCSIQYGDERRERKTDSSNRASRGAKLKAIGLDPSMSFEETARVLDLPGANDDESGTQEADD